MLDIKKHKKWNFFQNLKSIMVKLNLKEYEKNMKKLKYIK